MRAWRRCRSAEPVFQGEWRGLLLLVAAISEFIREMLGAAPTGVVNLIRKDFDVRCPRLVHSTKEIVLNG